MQDSFSSTDRSFPPLFPSSSLFVQLENELRSQIQIPAKITGRPVAHSVEEPETRACSDWQTAHPLTHPMFWIANINFCPLIGILNPSFSMQQVEKFFYSLVYYAGRIILLLFWDLTKHKVAFAANQVVTVVVVCCVWGRLGRCVVWRDSQWISVQTDKRFVNKHSNRY